MTKWLNPRFWPLWAALLAAASLPSPAAPDQGGQILHGHVPQAIQEEHLAAVGRLPSAQALELAIGLPLRNRTTLTNLLAEIYDPQSPHFHQYLTPDEFTARFGPTEADYAAVVAFARTNGLEVTGTHKGRLLVDVRGKVADIERALHVTLRTYPHPTEPRTFYAPDTEPSLNLAVPLAHIGGLDDYTLPHPAIAHAGSPQLPVPLVATGSGTNGAYMGYDFRAAYAPGVSLTGTGQKVALLEFDGYYLYDVTNYFAKAGLAGVTVTNVYVDSFSGNPGSDNEEPALDIEMAASMAPGASIWVYEIGAKSPTDDILDKIATDNLARQISSSWFFNVDDVAQNYLIQFAMQGQSYFNASGDTGAGGGTPADNPNVISVGGTVLSTTGPGGSWSSEQVWNLGSASDSGGGISATFTIPSWQTNVSMALNQGSTTMRNFPDVAMVAANILIYYNNGAWEIAGGTSAAAPLWAGYTALINQQATNSLVPPVGFFNPAIYFIGGSPQYAAVFHDITVGNNTNHNSPHEFFAAPGYDLCTGWGTPVGQPSILALAGLPDALQVIPPTGFPVTLRAGTYAAANKTYTITNGSGSTLDWSLINPSEWQSVSAAGGAVPGHSTFSLQAGLDPSVTNLAVGSYSNTLVFSNNYTAYTTSNTFTLQVTPMVINGGFESGDLTGWTLVGDTTNNGQLYDGVIPSSSSYGNCAHSGTYGMAMGDTNVAWLSQSLPTTRGGHYLLSFWLENNAGSSGPGQQLFIVDWNTNATSTNQVFRQSYSGGFFWTNMEFILPAAGPSTVLQFGAQNNQSLFGLDDISVTPLTTPAFQSVTATNGSVQLSWNAFSGVAYQLQYRTNLTQGGWVNLGTPYTASGPAISATDANPLPGPRFYRVILQLP